MQIVQVTVFSIAYFQYQISSRLSKCYAVVLLYAFLQWLSAFSGAE